MTTIYLLPTLAAIEAGRPAHEFESQDLEFKEEKAHQSETERDLADAAICLANAGGGTVVVGVSDRVAGVAAFIGTSLEPDTLRKAIHALTDPHLLVSVTQLSHLGKRLLAVEIPEGVEVYADTKGRAYRRIGDQCRPMTPADVSRLREDRMGFDWSAQRSTRRPEQVSPVVMATLRATLAGLPDDRRGLADRNDLDLLGSLGLVDGDRLNHAGEVLLLPAERDDSRLVYQFRPTPGGEPAAVERLAQPIVVAFPRMMEVIRARLNSAPLTLPDGQQIQLQDFPELAVREAIMNGLIHRDYRLPGPVSVEHSPAVLRIASPGPLVSGVTVDNILTHPPKPRNRMLSNATRKLGFGEEYGRGVDRMYVSMMRAGRQIPVINADADQVTVQLVGGASNMNIARYVAGLPTVERDDTDALLTLYQLCSERTVSADSVAPVLQRSPNEAEAILGRLAASPPAMIELARGGRRLRGALLYKLSGQALAALGPAVAYQTRTGAETDRKVVAHVAEYGHVTNRTLQNLFDLTMHRANAVLDDLIKREILVKTSTHQRGPGVEYGPGRRFPRASRSARRQVRDGGLGLWDDRGGPGSDTAARRPLE
jgi:ATP-dependent DNA helicase RecG